MVPGLANCAVTCGSIESPLSTHAGSSSASLLQITLEVDGVTVIVLPRPPLDASNENNNSVLVRLEFGAFSMLFAGDAEDRERNWLLNTT